jgi:crotonobetainyl-CoA:carnitine CoA-transferase CaiB-like acyl-CoA transferase
MFCTALLASYGAAVTAVEDISGHPRSLFRDTHLATNSVYGAYLGRKKRQVSLDLSTAVGREELSGLVRDADCVVDDWSEDLFDYLSEGSSREPDRERSLVKVSVTPHGHSGPRGGMPASDLTLFHGGGPGHATPGLVSDPDTMPPLRMGGHQGLFVSGLAAAINLSAALFLARRQPTSTIVEVDFSCHEAMANAFRQSLGTFAFYGGGLNRDLSRGRGAGGTAEHRNIRCKDGWFNLAWAGVQWWESVKELLGNPAWMADERLSTPALRYRNWALVLPRLEEWAQQHEKEHLFYLLQGYRIPCAPVNDGPDLLASELFASRTFWDDSTGSRMPGMLSRIEHGPSSESSQER